MKIECIVARIITGPIWHMKEVNGDKYYSVETILDTEMVLTYHTFFFTTLLEASQLRVGDIVLIDTGVDYEK